MIKKFALSGIIAAGAAGFFLSAAPAQAATADLHAAFQQTAAAQMDMGGGGGHKPKCHKGKKHKSKHCKHKCKVDVKKSTKKSVKVKKSSNNAIDTEGHETDITQGNRCNNNKTKVGVGFKNSKYNKVSVAVPSKGGCKLKAKTVVKNHGDVTTKKVRQ